MVNYYNPPPNYSRNSTGNVPNPARDYNVNPEAKGIAPRVFGGNPGRVDLPNIYGQMSDVNPALPPTNIQLGQNVLASARGVLSPEETGNIQDYQARFGVESGMPGSELGTNLGARTVGTSTAALQRQGLQDYSGLNRSIFDTMLVNPSLQLQTAMFNAENAAKEDPGIGALLGGMGGGGGM